MPLLCTYFEASCTHVQHPVPHAAPPAASQRAGLPSLQIQTAAGCPAPDPIRSYGLDQMESGQTLPCYLIYMGQGTGVGKGECVPRNPSTLSLFRGQGRRQLRCGVTQRVLFAAGI